MRQVSVTTGLPQTAKAAQRDRKPVFIIKLCCDSQCLEKVVPCLLPLLLLRHPAQLVIGTGLAVAVIELDTDSQSLLVVLLCLSPLPLFLR